MDARPLLGGLLLLATISLRVGAEAPPEPLPWRVTLIDAESKQPIPNGAIECSVRDEPGGDSRSRALHADQEGVVEIPLLPGEATFVYIQTPGYWSNGWPVVGEYDWDDDGQFDGAARNAPRSISLWKGTAVSGRLVSPEGDPVAGAPIHVGVNLSDGVWQEKLGRTKEFWSTWDRGQWPDWTTHGKSDTEGNFTVTVPPPQARSYIRLGTRPGSFEALKTDRLAETQPDHVLVRYAPLIFDASEQNRQGQRPCLVADDGTISLGDIQLQRGVVLHGHVLDRAGQPLEGVHLFTSGEHGPLAGRSTVSKADGSYRFAPMAPGELTLKPDATVRGEDGKKSSHDVQAVFVPLTVVLPKEHEELKVDIRALKHVDLDIKWVDRRKEKGPAAYHGTMRVSGRLPNPAEERLWWQGNAFLTQRDGQPVLTVKAPLALEDAKLQLAAGSRVTTTYQDEAGRQGPGRIRLGDITVAKDRTIYADEPFERNRQ